MNPYTSTGSVQTVTSSIAGKHGGATSDVGYLDESALTRPQVVRRLCRRIRPYRGLAALSLVSCLVATLLQLSIPLVIGHAIDAIVDAGRVDAAQLATDLGWIMFMVALAAPLQWLQAWAISRLTYATARDVRIEAFDKVHRLPLSLLDQIPHGDLMARVTTDIDQMTDGLLQGAQQCLNALFTAVCTLVFMIALSVPMTIVVVLATPLSLAAAALIGRLSDASFEDQQRIQGDLGAHIEEYVGAQRLVEVFGYGQRAQDRFDVINERLHQVGERAQFLSSLSNPGTRFVNNVIYAIVAVFGCLCAITSFPAPLTVGGVQVFLSYANQYTKPFSDLTGVMAQMQTAFASAKRLFALLDADDEAPDAPDAITLGKPRGSIEVNHVNFSYDGSTTVLHDICFKARPGERVALVGPTGCGKTTLINVLLRFYDTDSGAIVVDGCDVRRFTRASLRCGFGMVLQDTWLFEGTVHDNIAYGKPGASRAEVVAAARRARIDESIAALPQGYDTVLAANADMLSAGQRQLLCIARVMLADPAILLLDEATSCIDTRTELQVQAAFDEVMRGRTSIVVAHRLSTVRDADCILVMRDGRIVERGTHDELLALGGFYAGLCQAQRD